MHDSSLTYTRRPKGTLAICSLYAFTGAAITASVIFSLLLFLSIHDKLLMQILFGSLAVIFELGKFFAWYEFGERIARKAFHAAFIALGFYCILAIISIGGSIGGINSATNVAQQYVDQRDNRVNAITLQISAIDDEIALNNKAADKYLELQMISLGVTRIQKENQVLREKQTQLRIERDSVPVSEKGSVISLIASLAKILNTTTEDAQSWLVIFLSVLLDIFAAFFVGLIGEELRFRHSISRKKEQEKADKAEHLRLLATQSYIEIEAPAQLEDQSLLIEKQMSVRSSAILQAAQEQDLKCSKKYIADILQLSIEEIDHAFEEFLSFGIVERKRNNHLRWIRQADVA
ncbi:Preprotein translocase subunit SecY [Moritella sp. 5]|uniref:Preprotein translocase subunit SecY n=1 Tax=Moritella sp. 5 TaxID=2746231 RepID=UPI001BA9C7E5|nr:Preprotein translocase subunit SecY [Moritella sp. 5]QUM80485.1 Preprotein translocase subunit SecY [Moritella sp. 5]